MNNALDWIIFNRTSDRGCSGLLTGVRTSPLIPLLLVRPLGPGHGPWLPPIMPPNQNLPSPPLLSLRIQHSSLERCC